MPRQMGWDRLSNDDWAVDGQPRGDSLKGAPSGPGEHGFSGVYGHATPADERPAETVRRSESPGMASDIRHLAESADLPDRADKYEAPPFLFVEELSAKGVRQAAIEADKAYVLPCDVRLIPSVPFSSS